MRSAWLFSAIAPLALMGQQLPAGRQVPNRMEITLERRVADRWQKVDPGLIFDRDDRLRFRFQPNFSGYLYVMNHSTSGSDTLLFPREDTGSENRIEAGKEYEIPTAKQWLRITGPAGYENVSWIVSPIPLDGPPAPARRAERTLPHLIPRCDDGVFRARGECVDSAAGARLAPEAARKPQSADLTFLREREKSIVSSVKPLEQAVVYQFRIAHR